MQAKTQYTRSGDVHIAYQVLGSGPRDVVFVPGFVSHLEAIWEDPSAARFFERLASFARLILFDKRGTGLSDRVPTIATLEERMDDVRAVMSAVDSEKAALFGLSEGGPMALLFSATYPEKTSALVLFGAFAKFTKGDHYPWALRPDQVDEVERRIERQWGSGYLLPWAAPSLVDDQHAQAWYARFERMAASPGAAIATVRMNAEIDVRHILPSICVPTLILHRTGDRLVHVGHSRYMAERIEKARFVECPGVDHVPWVGAADVILDEIEEFLTGVRHGLEPDRVLATLLFTDIVGATDRAAALGDRQWRDLLERHHNLVRRELNRFRGREVDTAGDAFFATFDGPARAIRCACAIRDAVTSLGITVRAGLHTGECAVMDEKVTGIAVHIGARVMGQAGPGEVLVSSTVKDLVAGSGLDFVERGVYALKGVPGEWHLFAVQC
jgi:pimeloyl-ACP methyl ester carboxylesterase